MFQERLAHNLLSSEFVELTLNYHKEGHCVYLTGSFRKKINANLG